MVKIWRIGFEDRPNVVMTVVAAGARIGGEEEGMRELDKDDAQNFNFRNWKRGVNINQKEGERLWQAQVLGKDQDFGFGCAKFGATIDLRLKLSGGKWEVGLEFTREVLAGVMEQARRPLHCYVTLVQSLALSGPQFSHG